MESSPGFLGRRLRGEGQPEIQPAPPRTWRGPALARDSGRRQVLVLHVVGWWRGQWVKLAQKTSALVFGGREWGSGERVGLGWCSAIVDTDLCNHILGCLCGALS